MSKSRGKTIDLKDSTVSMAKKVRGMYGGPRGANEPGYVNLRHRPRRRSLERIEGHHFFEEMIAGSVQARTRVLGSGSCSIGWSAATMSSTPAADTTTLSRPVRRIVGLLQVPLVDESDTVRQYVPLLEQHLEASELPRVKNVRVATADPRFP